MQIQKFQIEIPKYHVLTRRLEYTNYTMLYTILYSSFLGTKDIIKHL